jgi:hypothetical protein
MTGTATELVLVVLNVAPGIEDAVVDWLLGRAGHTGFTSSTVYGHSSRHEGLNVAEQVRGRRRRTQFEIHMGRDAVRDFIAEAHAEFGGADVHCLVLPAIAAGSLATVLEAGL